MPKFGRRQPDLNEMKMATLASVQRTQKQDQYTEKLIGECSKYRDSFLIETQHFILLRKLAGKERRALNILAQNLS